MEGRRDVRQGDEDVAEALPRARGVEGKNTPRNRKRNSFSRTRHTRSSCECRSRHTPRIGILPCIKVSDLPSLPKIREQIELPRKEAQTLFAAGKQLRQIANDLYQMLDEQTPPCRSNGTQSVMLETDEPDGIVAPLRPSRWPDIRVETSTFLRYMQMRRHAVARTSSWKG